MTVLYASDLESFGIHSLGEAFRFYSRYSNILRNCICSFISVRGQTQPLNTIYEKVGFLSMVLVLVQIILKIFLLV